MLSIEPPAAREILVVDDGSTDGTREVLDGIEADRLAVTVLRAARNGGKGSAIRRGLAGDRDHLQVFLVERIR